MKRTIFGKYIIARVDALTSDATALERRVTELEARLHKSESERAAARAPKASAEPKTLSSMGEFYVDPKKIHRLAPTQAPAIHLPDPPKTKPGAIGDAPGSLTAIFGGPK